MLKNILMMFLLKKDVFHTPNITVELVELDKPVNLVKLLVDGQKNQSELFLAQFKTYNLMPMLKILKILLLSMFKQTQLLKEEEEHTEHTEELVHIFHLNAMSKCGQLRRLQMLKRKEKQNKSQKEKFQLEKNDENI